MITLKIDGLKERLKNSLNYLTNNLNDNPFLFTESDKSNGLRKSVLSRQTTIYYRIIDYEIRIVKLFDNRQNPNRLINK